MDISFLYFIVELSQVFFIDTAIDWAFIRKTKAPQKSIKF